MLMDDRLDINENLEFLNSDSMKGDHRITKPNCIKEF